MEMALHNKKRGSLEPLFSGWKVGFEPTTHGTTIRYSNQLSYTHHLIASAKVQLFLKNETIIEEKNLSVMIILLEKKIILL